MSVAKLHHHHGSLPQFGLAVNNQQLRHVDLSHRSAAALARDAASGNINPLMHPTHVTSTENRQNFHNNLDLGRPLPPAPLSFRDPNTPVASSKQTSRKPSPRLLERLHLLSARKPTSTEEHDQAPGRIPESQIQAIDHFHSQNRQIVVDKKGSTWSGPGLQPQATGGGVPQLSLELDNTFQFQFPADSGSDSSALLPSSAMAGMVHESDASSIISVSDRYAPSDSESEQDPHTDTQKYRLPDLGKSRGSSRNGFVLEDGRLLERDRPPTPPPKDTPHAMESPSKEDHYPYFHPRHMSRTDSIYTLSRASFSNQLSQLTAIKLPPASSLASSIASISTSASAARALNEASGQIRIWMTKVTEVLEGLDAEDDIEWAAAGGRDGLGDVDTAINRFEGLIDVYVTAIEQLEGREDIASLHPDALQEVVDRMERILKDWDEIKNVLEGVKSQVELAMEWEELWNTVLGEIGQEVEALSRLIFEMEERRHRGILDAMAEPGKVLDINELETIVEEAPSRSTSVAQTQRKKGEAPATPQAQQYDEDKNLVSLFARMQPLRASLDFFPMRLSAFLLRGRSTFPTGCEELEKRLEFLEAKYKKIEFDAESLKKELGEDRWVIIFRKAAEKALKMCESVDRSIAKLREALEDGVQHTNPPVLAKKLENYEAKKEHYGPAIQQVLGIIDKGVQTRLTVNGEILRLQTDMNQRWLELQANLKGMDFAVEQLQISKIHHQLRDSISTILSEQRSVSSSMMDTPSSSPASSVVFLSRQSSDQGTVSTPYGNKSRTGSIASSNAPRPNAGKRLSSLPTPMTGSTYTQPRKTPLLRSSVADLRPSFGVSSRLYSTPAPARSFSRADSRADMRPADNKPRWNSSTKTIGTSPFGHNYPPLLASPYQKSSPTPVHTPRLAASSGYGQPSPLSFGASTNGLHPPSALAAARPPSALRGGRPPSALASARSTSTSTTIPKLRQMQSSSALSTARPPPTPMSTAKTSSYLPRASIYSVSGTPTASYAPSATSTSSTVTVTNQGRQISTAMSYNDDDFAETGAEGDAEATPSKKASRPMSSMGGRRTSMLPTPRRAVSSQAPQSDAAAAAAAAMNGRTSRAGAPSRAGLNKRQSMAFSTGTAGQTKWR